MRRFTTNLPAALAPMVSALLVSTALGMAAPASASPADLADALEKTGLPTVSPDVIPTDLDMALAVPVTDQVETPVYEAKAKSSAKDGGNTASAKTPDTNSGGSGDTASSTDIKRIGVRQALRGKALPVRCVTVRGIRPWRLAKRRLLRLRYRRAVVVRFVPRKVVAIAGKTRKATCTGGWYLVRARKGRTKWRLAVDARTFRIAARIRY